ncbi:hypothetical protein GCM10022243_25330 [Saccharothrix violaceirubra]
MRELREREERLGRMAAAFFEQDALRERHELASARSVVGLLDAGEPVDAVAELLGVEVSRVRWLARRCR